MLLRIMTLLMTLTITLTGSLSAGEKIKKFDQNIDLATLSACASSNCNACRIELSAAELLQLVQSILNNNILLLPQLEPQLVAQLQQLITEGGIPVVGPTGPAGPTGATGATGATGSAGGALDFADFYALMPPNNESPPPILAGDDVDFPLDGPSSGSGNIARTGVDSFNLAEIGIYQVFFQVSVTEDAQLILTLNGADLAYTVVGRATGSSQIIGMALVETTTIDSVLTVRNPAGNDAFTVTPDAGGNEPVSAHLVITRIK